jgi:hypothetical protein
MCAGITGHRPRFELRVIPYSAAMDEAEAQLTNSLVTWVGDTLPHVSLDQVMLHLARFYEIGADEVWVSHYNQNDFLLSFSDHRLVDRVQHVALPWETKFTVLFRWWCCQSEALFSPMCFKVLLSITHLLVHAWSLKIV